MHEFYKSTVPTIDLILIDQQRVGKRSLRLIVTVNAKKRWTTILACQQIFKKVLHSDTLAKDRASFLKVMTLMTFHFWERLIVIIIVL
jgi:hypothetical protein